MVSGGDRSVILENTQSFRYRCVYPTPNYHNKGNVPVVAKEWAGGAGGELGTH